MREHDGRLEILLVALVLSACAHFAIMWYVRRCVMTHVTAAAERSARHEPMRVTKAETPPAALLAEMLPDVDALKDAPAAETVGEAPVAAPREADKALAKASVPVPQLSDLPQPQAETPSLDVHPLSIDKPSFKITLPETGVARPRLASVGAPSAAPLAPGGRVAGPLSVPSVAALEPLPDEPVRIVPEKAEKAEKKFEPAEMVREKVDEQVVEKEKEAVRELLDVARADELRKVVTLAVTKTDGPDGTYFRIMLHPRHELPVVEKDLVVLIDASGSIGRDRIRSIREAARRVLRSALNSGDRFNLVAFRDRYSYAFRAWQGCTQSAFDQADAWLGEVTAHGRTDVFGTISSVLTLPRTPERPLVALVITDGDANVGVRTTAEILSKFTALNDGLVSVYMYGVKSSANRELIDVLTHGNRGESLVYDGWMKWKAGSEIETFTERFRDPVLSDLRVAFASGIRAEVYPRLLRNLYLGGQVELVGRVPAGTKEVALSIRGLNGKTPYEGYFKLQLEGAAADGKIVESWRSEQQIDLKLK